MSNKEDIQAINGYVTNKSKPAAGAPAYVINKWQNLVSKWKGFYSKVMGSWYVSDADLAQAKNIRNQLMQNQNPDAWQWVQETSADKPGKKTPWSEKPDAPKETKTPWKAEGLTYSGKYKTKEDVAELQKKINAAGYKPPLKVDGKYGPATQNGERWLNLQQNAKAAAAKIEETAKPVAPVLVPSKPKPEEVPKKVPPPPAPTMLFGIPVNVRSVVGAAAGGAAGFLAGGPWGAAIGLPTGFAAGGTFFAGEDDE